MTSNGFLGVGVVVIIRSSFAVQMDYARSTAQDIDKKVDNIGASYAAEASLNKALLSVKSEDINGIDAFSNKMALGAQKDMQYGFINKGADAGYFDLTLNNSPSYDIDLGSMNSRDITFENIQSADLFDTFVLNYNKSVNQDLLVEIIKSNKSGSFTTCDVYGKVDGECSYIDKFVVNTSDSSMNGMVADGYQIYFRAGENGFSNKVLIQGINPSSYNYKITFSTLSGKNTDFSYYVSSGGAKKKIVNNLVEIDTIGTAIDNYSRVKLVKKITNNIQPNSKYVLFSDSEIIK